MQIKLAEVARLVGGEVVGDENTIVSGVSGILEAKAGDLTFVANAKYSPLIKTTKATAVIIPRDMDSAEKPAIKTDNPSLAFTQVLNSITPKEPLGFSGVHATAFIGKDVSLGENVSIGPNAIIEESSSIGAGTVIYGGAYVGRGSKIGKDGIIYPNVTIRENIQIGNNVIIHSGTVIGSDGYGFVQVEGKHIKIPQNGTVVIEDDVEIGSNVTVDRARFNRTVIGRGTKIDNLVQVAHNVQIGENCLMVAQSGISGSSSLENNVTIAGQTGVAGHLTIGAGSVVAAKSGVTNDVPSGVVVSGFPVKDHEHTKRVMAATQKLPEAMKKIRELEQKIQKLEQGQS